MKLVVGLGNPGGQYELTRHNVGFLIIDQLTDQWKATPLPDKYNAQLYSATVKGERILMMKPQTYMNLSGESVGPAFAFYKCAPQDLIVIHDEIDLPPMKFRVKKGGGTAGHNGIKSVNKFVGSDNLDYLKVRFGVGRPEHQTEPALRNMKPVDFVLSRFRDIELNELEDVIPNVASCVEMLIAGNIKEAMNKYNQKEKVDNGL